MIEIYMSEMDIVLQQACDEMDKQNIVILPETLAEFQSVYNLEVCRQWIEDTCNGGY
jgi:hypothetical protein